MENEPCGHCFIVSILGVKWAWLEFFEGKGGA